MVGLVNPQGATNALTSGYNFMQGISQDRARRDAGNALASGDVNAAMSALGGAGDLQSVQALQQGQQQQAQSQTEAEQEERTRRLEFVGQAADAIYRAPPAERDAVWAQIRPVFQQMGYPDDLLMQMDRAPKTDANLQAVITAAGGEIAAPQTFNTSQGIVRETRPGTFENVFPVEREQTAPAGYRFTPDGNMEYIRGGPADPNVVGTRAAAGRAPPRGGGGSRGGGGGGSRPAGPAVSAGSGSLPAGFSVRR